MSLLQAQSAQSSDQTKMRPSVFSAISVDDFLRQYFEWRKRIQPTFSLRMLSKKLDFRSHSLLAMIVRGERNPSPEVLKQLADFAELSEREYDYLLTLLLFKKSKNPREKLRLGSILTKQKPTTDELVIEVDAIAIFERWYHIAILEMTLLKNFVSDADWIASQLGPTVSSSMVQDAIERLLRSGLLELDQQGNLKKVTLVTRTRPFITTAAMRSYQKQMLQRASVSIEAQAVSRRLFMNSMMPFNSQDTDDAKEMIAEFVEKFRTRFSSPGGDTVYILGTHLFHITEPPATVTEPTERH